MARKTERRRAPVGAYLSLVLMGMVLATCATPTPYQRSTGYDGYSEKLLEPNRYRVSFYGNSLTKRETVEDYLLYRAAELTVETGNDYFVMVERETDKNTRYQTSFTDPWPYYGFYYSSFYRYPYHIGFQRDVYTRQVTRYTASSDIVVYSGEKPADNVNAYDARAIMQNLGPGVLRPQGAAG